MQNDLENSKKSSIFKNRESEQDCVSKILENSNKSKIPPEGSSASNRKKKKVRKKSWWDLMDQEP